MKDVFRQMPDSLMPYLSENNRLDFIDFLESNMKAEVKNQLGGISEMTALTDDSLSIQASQALRVDMILLPLIVPTDSCSQVICFVQTFGTDSVSMQTTVEYFTPKWKRLAVNPQLSQAVRKRIEALELQTILKWDEKILKKN
ncbi:MAG: DUF3256 family protein [Prevotella sp.]|nr:DUF3256 family protein [Prevotella sp.]